MKAADMPAGLGHPYVGPRPFRQADADRFFGRGRESRDLRSLWMAERVLVLHGPSAVGKTSLLHAGVLPLLAAQNEVDVLPIGRLTIQAVRPLAEGPPHNGYSFTLISSWSRAGQPISPGLSITDFCRRHGQRVNESDEPNGILAAIDQFEELFTSFPARHEEREGFIEELGEALQDVPTLRLLLVLRDDHLATLAAIERRLPYPATHLRLDPLAQDAALDAVQEPLKKTGRSFGKGVAKEFVDTLRTTTYTDLVGESATLTQDWVEPLLLQIVGLQLWASLPAQLRTIQSRDLRKFGNVDDAIMQFYETAIREIQLETGESEERLRTWIEATFITEHGTRGNAYRGFGTTSDMPNKVVDMLAERHILSSTRRALGTWYELSQDRLIGAVRRSNMAWRGEHGQGMPEFESVVASPSNFRAAAEEAFGLGNYPMARRFAEAAASRYRESGDGRRLAQTLVLEGDISRAEGDLDAARENLRAALSSFSILEDRNSTARTLSALADVCLSAGDYSAAEDFQQQALRWYPADVEALIGLGYAQWYLGSPADAEVSFTQALSWNPREARALAGRGQVRAQMQEYETALADLDTALEHGLPFADEIDAHSARAVVLVALGRHEDGDRELGLARTQEPLRARTHVRAGQVAVVLGRTAEARRELEAALQQRSGLAPAEQESAEEMLRALG